MSKTITIPYQEYLELESYKRRFRELRVAEYAKGISIVMSTLAREKDGDRIFTLIKQNLEHAGLVMITGHDTGVGSIPVDIVTKNNF